MAALHRDASHRALGAAQGARRPSGPPPNPLIRCAPRLHACRIQIRPQELQALIKYIQMNKESDTDWFTIQPQDGGKRWTGKCWCARALGRVGVMLRPLSSCMLGASCAAEVAGSDGCWPLGRPREDMGGGQPRRGSRPGSARGPAAAGGWPGSVDGCHTLTRSCITLVQILGTSTTTSSTNSTFSLTCRRRTQQVRCLLTSAPLCRRLQKRRRRR